MIGKKEMVTQIVEYYNNEHEDKKLTKVAAAEMFDTVVNTLVNMLESGVEVAVPNLGRFKIMTRSTRTARNPQDGSRIEIPQHCVVKYAPAKSLKEAVYGL